MSYHHISIMMITCHQFEASKGVMTCDHYHWLQWSSSWSQLWWSHIISSRLVRVWWHVINNVTSLMSWSWWSHHVTSLMSWSWWSHHVTSLMSWWSQHVTSSWHVITMMMSTCDIIDVMIMMITWCHDHGDHMMSSCDIIDVHDHVTSW